MNIIIVSPAYPPYSGVGGIRMNSLSKHLRNIGDQVFVLRNTPALWGEKNLKAEVPQGIKIIDINACKNEKENAELYYQAIYNIVQRNTIDLVIFSVGPFYTLRIAPRIKNELNIKYIIDFRDLWVFEKRGSRGWLKDLKHFVYRNMKRCIERSAVKSADAVAVVTPGDKKTMCKHYKKKKDQIYTIYNGYEAIPDKTEEGFRKNDVLTLTSFGKFGYYSPELVKVLFAAVNDIAGSGTKIAIKHIGQEETFVDKLFQDGRYKNVMYHCTGYVSYETGMREVQQSDICVITYNHPTGFGTKVFDYIACNKPIILLTKQGKALAELVSSFSNGFVCESTEEVEKAIQSIMENDIKTLDEQSTLKQYSRIHQNNKYIDLIKEIM